MAHLRSRIYTPGSPFAEAALACAFCGARAPVIKVERSPHGGADSIVAKCHVCQGLTVNGRKGKGRAQ